MITKQRLNSFLKTLKRFINPSRNLINIAKLSIIRTFEIKTHIQVAQGMRQLLQFNQILCIVLVFVNFALLIAATVLTNIAIVSIDKEKYDVHRCISAVQIVNTFILAAVPLGVVFFE